MWSAGSGPGKDSPDRAMATGTPGPTGIAVAGMSADRMMGTAKLETIQSSCTVTLETTTITPTMTGTTVMNTTSTTKEHATMNPRRTGGKMMYVSIVRHIVTPTGIRRTNHIHIHVLCYILTVACVFLVHYQYV
jgi:hypothetical protein